MLFQIKCNLKLRLKDRTRSSFCKALVAPRALACIKSYSLPKRYGSSSKILRDLVSCGLPLELRLARSKSYGLAHKILLRLNTDISPNPFRDEPFIISLYRKVIARADRKKGGGNIRDILAVISHRAVET